MRKKTAIRQILELLAMALSLLTPAFTHAQRCPGGLRIEGAVLDPTGAAITNPRRVSARPQCARNARTIFSYPAARRRLLPLLA